MADWLEITVTLALLLGIGVVIAVLLIRGERWKRSRAMAHLAERLGYRFTALPRANPLATYGHLSTLSVPLKTRIQAARRFFNGNVRDYNNKVMMFPSSLIACAWGFVAHDFFEIAALERNVPSAATADEHG